jgi:hypothetical protein
MSAEAQKFNEADKATIKAIAEKFMPYTYKTGYFGNGHANTTSFKTPSIPLRLISENGNEWLVAELVSKIFFEQYIFFTKYLFERDTQHEWERRLTPLADINFHDERAACYSWIAFRQSQGKVGCNELDWFRTRIEEIYGIIL